MQNKRNILDVLLVILCKDLDGSVTLSQRELEMYRSQSKMQRKHEKFATWLFWIIV